MKGSKYGGNMYLIVIYDIKQEENYAKRQRYVFKTCKKYLTHIQNSVFEGELDRAQYLSLSSEFKKYFDGRYRSHVLYFQLGIMYG